MALDQACAGGVCPCTATSQYSTWSCSRMMDRIISTNNQFRNAGGSTYEYVKFDLGISQYVSAVYIWTRADCCASESDSQMFIGDDSTTFLNNRRCSTWNSFSSVVSMKNSSCDRLGCYVYFSKNGGGTLSAGEIAIFGGCTPCPDGTTTIANGRVDIGQCYVSTLQPPVNPANHYSVNGRMREVQVGATVVANTVLSASTAA
eukprot:515604-Hanusia_phi.AAC.2